MKRIEFFDIIKGIGIVLVVLGHVTKNLFLYNFIYAFHMPLFFIVSGYFLHDKKNFIRSQANNLLIPYFSFGILSFLYWWLFELSFRSNKYEVDVLNQFINLFIPQNPQLCNIVLWFLPCLFIASIITNQINKVLISNVKKLYIILLLVFSVGLFKGDIPFLLGQSLQSVPFMLIGSAAASHQVLQELVKKNVRIMLSILALICLVPILFIGVTCNMLSSTYIPCYPVSFMVALWATVCVSVLSYSIYRNKILSWLGTNSLAIMLMHEPIKRVVIKLYSVITGISIDYLRESIVHSLLMTAIVLLILIPLILFVNRYTPFLLGKTIRKLN